MNSKNKILEDGFSIVLYDGVCNLCHGFVQWIIKRDKANLYRFASLQSDIGQKLLGTHNMNASDFTSVVLIKDKEVYIESEAAIRIVCGVGGGYSFFRYILVIPKWIRDTIYRWISMNRYRIFGKNTSCELPGENFGKRFLDLER